MTDYTYDSGHGGLLTVTAPADSNGVRPKSLFGYTSIYAYYKNSSGAVVQGPAPFTVPDVVRTCRTGTQPSCLGTADEWQPTLVYNTSGSASNGLPYLSVNRNGDGSLYAATAISYDSRGWPFTIDGPQSGTADRTMFAYRDDGRLQWQIDPDPDGAGSAEHLATYYNYRPDGQIDFVQEGTVDHQLSGAMSTWAELQRTNALYDSYHRPIRQALSSGGTYYQVIDTRYDALSRAQCTILRMDPSNWGTLASSCSPPQANDRVTYNHYDTLGRTWKVTTGYGTSVAADDQIATFTANGQLLTLTDAENNRTTYEYDGHDRLVKTLFPVGTKGAGSSNSSDYEQVGYDANGNVTSFRTRRNETLTMTYDYLNRLITRVVPERSGLSSTHTRDVYYAYDLFGNMTVAGFDSFSPSDKVVNAYDALGQLVTSTTTMDGVSRALGYQYDVAGNLFRLTHPDGNLISYNRYASSGALYYTDLNGSSPLFHPSLDTAGRLLMHYRWNPSAANWYAGITSYAYDGMSRPSAYSMDLAGTSYDIWSTSFAYNPASQITSRTHTNDTYAFPGYANVNRNYTSNGLNQYSAVASTGFSYDTNGNLTSDGTDSYVYDVENRLVTRSGGASATLRYDPLGRLYEVYGSQTGTTRFLYDGDALVAEYNTSGTLLRRYVHGTSAGDDPLVWFEGSGVTNAERRYLYADERGSIVMVTDSAGVAYQLTSYDEYGIPGHSGTALTPGGRFRYTGQAWIPELGMYYYKARMYSPTLGRFMQTDPIGYGDGMNMYAYVGGDPVNFVDPSGLQHCRNDPLVPGSGQQDCIFVSGERPRPDYSGVYAYLWSFSQQASITQVASAPPWASDFLENEVQQSEPQSVGTIVVRASRIGRRANRCPGCFLGGGDGFDGGGASESFPDPEFANLRDHWERHGEELRTRSANQYYRQAVRNISVGRDFRFRYNGQQRMAHITRLGSGTFMFTSTNLSSSRIYTHLVVRTAYLSNIGITLPKGF